MYTHINFAILSPPGIMLRLMLEDSVLAGLCQYKKLSKMAEIVHLATHCSNDPLIVIQQPQIGNGKFAYSSIPSQVQYSTNFGKFHKWAKFMMYSHLTSQYMENILSMQPHTHRLHILHIILGATMHAVTVNQFLHYMLADCQLQFRLHNKICPLHKKLQNNSQEHQHAVEIYIMQLVQYQACMHCMKLYSLPLDRLC